MGDFEDQVRRMIGGSNRNNGPGARPQGTNSAPRQRHGNQLPLDPSAYQRDGAVRGYYQPQPPGPRQLFNPNMPRGPPPNVLADQRRRQVQFLDQVAATEVAKVEMTTAERDEKEAFRASLQSIIHELCDTDQERLQRVALECFGSFQSGFASAGSDMDLVIVLQDTAQDPACFSLLEDDLPRRLEERLLQLGYGARLLTKTRVPIIKICEKPNPCLLDKLRQERERWNDLPNEKKYPHLHQDDEATEGEDVTTAIESNEQNVASMEASSDPHPKANGTNGDGLPNGTSHETAHKAQQQRSQPHPPLTAPPQETMDGEKAVTQQRTGRPRQWTRERKAGLLDFPKTGVGVQSDIIFFNPLGLHNTQLLRCYSACDSRVRPMVLFVKAWAKQRKINSSYSGTLSSYGYVLMVLHYLTNVAQPPVLPNLQMPWRPSPQCTPPGASRAEVGGWVVDFWRNEDEIVKAVQSRQMSSNSEPLGSLLNGFFSYYSSQGGGPQFHWMMDVLSLRTPGGRLSKEEKGWTKAMTEEGDGKKVQHRYLFCIEDPFELAHNVARTVTHPGIVAIRDEFRRAKRILNAVGTGQGLYDGELFAQLVEIEDLQQATQALQLDGTGGSNGLTPNAAQPQGYNTGLSQKRQMSYQKTAPKPKQLNLADNEDFPSLGPAKPKKQNVPNPAANGDFGEISGNRAQAYLHDLKTKKEEAQAEQTATGAAESVLDGDD